MSNKHGGKSRHPPVTFNSIKTKIPRSRSVNNTIEHEVKLQTAIKRNQNDSKVNEKQTNVTQLIQHFEKSQSTENLSKTTEKLQRKSSVIYTSLTNPSVQQTEILRRPLVQSKSVPHYVNRQAETKLETLARSSSSLSISDEINHLGEISDNESVMTMTQPSLLISEEFIRSQSVVAGDIELSSSFDENKLILAERINEICATEETYIKTLDILSSKFPIKVQTIFRKDDQVNKLFEKLYRPLIAIIDCLHEFHSHIILPYLQTYRQQHHHHTREFTQIWSIFEQYFSTIKELYESFYRIFDSYQKELKHLKRSFTLKKLHKAISICENDLSLLSPISEFNVPNQRLVRYILLIKTYSKHFKEDSSEANYLKSIHNEFTNIAVHCEEQLVISTEEFTRLKTRIDSKSICFNNQQLYWHGSLRKQSLRKRNDITQIYLIVLSNFVLICEKSGQKFDVKRQISIESLVVESLEDRRTISNNIYYPFRMKFIEKTYEFLVEREVEREKWINKIQKAKENFHQQTLIPNLHRSSNLSIQQSIGMHSPNIIEEGDVTRCQICHTRFGMKLILSNRHYCRSCGQWICSSCSTNKLLLRYRIKDGEVRVCDQCYSNSTGIHRYSIVSCQITRNPNRTILFGNFRCLSTSTNVWWELQDDFILHIYGGKLDQVDELAFDLPELRDFQSNEETRMFIFMTKDKRYKYILESNHENNYQEENIQFYRNKILFCVRLWYDAIQLARMKKLPIWYMEKRHSADSGICAV